MSEDMSPYCPAHDEWLIMKLCMYVGYQPKHSPSSRFKFGGRYCFESLAFAKENVKVNILSGIVLIKLASCSFRYTLSSYGQCV